MRDHLLLSHPNPHKWAEGPLQLWRRSDAYSYTNGNSNSDSNANSDAHSDSYTYGHSYGDSHTNGRNTDTYADLRPSRVATGPGPASGPLCLPSRAWHGQHALRRRRPERGRHADLVRSGLAL